MTRRVLLDASGLKVSKPGTDVLVAQPNQLQFSSDWAGLGRHIQGEVDCNWNEGAWRSYPFGKTFPSPPLAFLSRVNPNGTLDHYAPGGGMFWSFEENYEYPDRIEYNQAGVAAEVTASSIRVLSHRQNDSSWVTVPSFKLRWTILTYNL